MNDWSSNPLTTALALLAAAGVTVGTAVVLTTDPSPLSAEQRPLWATVLLATVLVGGVAAGAAVLWRGWDALSAYVVFLAGVLAGVGLVRIPLQSAGFTSLAGIVLACVGVWHLRPRALAADHRLALGAAALAAVVAELAFGAVSTFVWLLPYLWGAGGLGFVAAPVTAVVAVRAVRGVESPRRVPVALAGLGGVAFFLAPVVWSSPEVGAYAGCPGIHWSHFEYSVDLPSLTFSWEVNPCGSSNKSVERTPVLASLATFALGVVADRVVALRYPSAAENRAS